MDLETLLKEFGLTEAEAKTYRALADFNELSGTELAEKSGLKRTLVYHTVRRLIELGLASEFDKNKILYFRATNPENLDILLKSHQQKLEQMVRSLENISPILSQRYSIKGERPLIDVYTGLRGLEKIYDLILKEADELLIFASPLARKNPEVDALIRKQIKLQEEKNIKVRSLVKDSKPNQENPVFSVTAGTSIKLRFIPEDEFMSPTQVFIWKDSLALNTAGNEMISTIIRNSAISETFRIIFDALWKRAKESV